jgi:hypothetical protein
MGSIINGISIIFEILNMNKQQIIHLIIGITIVLSAAVIFFLSTMLEPRAAFFPEGISLLLFFFGSVLVIQQIHFKVKHKSAEGQTSIDAINKAEKSENNRRTNIVLITIPLLSVGFISIIPFIGFEASAFCLMFMMMMSISFNIAVKRIYIAIVTPVLLNLVFRLVLNIQLPSTFEFLFNYIQ